MPDTMMPTTAAIPTIPAASTVSARESVSGDVAAQVAKAEKRGNTRTGVITSVLASVAFASLFGIPGMLTGLDTFATFGWRVLAALPFLVVILFVLRQWPQMGQLLERLRENPRLILVLAVDALLFGVQVFLFAWGPMMGTALAVSFGYFLMPLVLVAIGVLVFRERLSKWGGVAVSFAAIGVVIALVAGASISWETFAVALGYPLYFILRRKFALDSPSAQSLEMLLLAPIALVFVLQPGALEAVAANPMNWLGIATLGLLTAVGFSAYTIAQRGLTVSVFGMLGYLEPILLVVVSIVLLGEPLGIADAWSYGAIGLAILALVIDGLPKRGKVRATPVAKRPVRAPRFSSRRGAKVAST